MQQHGMTEKNNRNSADRSMFC